MKRIVILILMYLTQLECTHKITPINISYFEGIWDEGEKVDTSEITTVLDLYIKKYKIDTLLLSYSAYSQRYISGESELIYGRVSIPDLLKQKPFVVKIQNADNIKDSFQVSLNFNNADSSITWNVLSSKSHEDLYIVRYAKLKKSYLRNL